MIQSVPSAPPATGAILAAPGKAVAGANAEMAEIGDFSDLLAQENVAADTMASAAAAAISQAEPEQVQAVAAADSGKILPPALPDDASGEPQPDRAGPEIAVAVPGVPVPGVPVAPSLAAPSELPAKGSGKEEGPIEGRPAAPQLPAAASQVAVAALLRRAGNPQPHEMQAGRPGQTGLEAVDATSASLPIERPSPQRKAATNPSPAEEIELDLTRLATPVPRGEARGGSEAALTASGAAEAVSAAALPSTGTANPQGAPAGISAVQPAVRPQDFSALIDRLTAAREAIVPHAAVITVAHQDFGPVRLRFRSEDSGLTVAMSSADPGFARAAAAVPPPVLPGSANEQNSLSHQRGEDGQAQPGGSGNSGRDARPDRRDGDPQAGQTPARERLAERRDGRRGIFA